MIKIEVNGTLILERLIETLAIKVSIDRENNKIIKENQLNILSPGFTICKKK